MTFSHNKSTVTSVYSYCKRVTNFIALYQTVDVLLLTAITIIMFIYTIIAFFLSLGNKPFYLHFHNTFALKRTSISLSSVTTDVTFPVN